MVEGEIRKETREAEEKREGKDAGTWTRIFSDKDSILPRYECNISSYSRIVMEGDSERRG